MSDPRLNKYQQDVVYSQPSELATNNVLRNTYMLLSMTLLFSAFCAYGSILMNFSLPNPWVFLIGALALQFFIHMTANSPVGLLATFVFTGFMGATAGPFINLIISTISNGPQLVLIAAGGTGLIFFGLSGYVLTTRKDMSFMGGALAAGSTVALVALLAAIFFNIQPLQLAGCVLFMLISAGMILYQTSAIIHGGETNYVIATVSLYLSIYNLFMTLLQLLMAFMSDR